MIHSHLARCAQFGAALGILISSALAGVANASTPSTSYPGEQPVRIVVPYSPGGTTDYTARLIAQYLSMETKGNFIVDNKAGASGQIGTMDVVRAKPDGHTLLAIDTSYTMLPALYPKLPWDPAKDIVPITNIADTPVILAVNADSPYKTLNDLIEAARKQPGAITYGSGGLGSSTDLAAAVFAQLAHIKLMHVPYKGAGQAMLGLLSKNVQLIISAAPTVIPQVKSGKLRALAISSEQRLNVLPDVPTFIEAGLPGYKVVNWFGLAAPKGTPKKVIADLQKWAHAAMQNAELKKSLTTLGASAGGIPVADFQKRINDDIRLWTEISTKAGRVKPQ